MIIIDNRVGSKELIKYLPKNTAKLGKLNYADASFLGTLEDRPVSVGIERKTIHDLLSSMQTGRLAGHQLVGLTATYDVIYLIVEGLWRIGHDGSIEVPRKGKWKRLKLGQRAYMGRELDSFLNTLQVLASMIVREATTSRHTAYIIRNLYMWWQKSSHQSHLAIHKNRFRGDGVLLTKPPLKRRMAAELDGVGWKRSLDVAKHFKSVEEMINADEKEWSKIQGIGKKLSKSIYKEIRST